MLRSSDTFAGVNDDRSFVRLVAVIGQLRRTPGRSTVPIYLDQSQKRLFARFLCDGIYERVDLFAII